MIEPEEISAKYRAPALEKGLDVLELLAARGAPMGMVQIAAALNRSVSELFRMVQVLEHRGYVANTPEGDGLVLTNKLFSLGMTRAPARSVLEAALPVMRRLTEVIGQSCHLAVASAGEMVVVARIEAPGNQGFSVRVGYHRAIVEATSGLVLYAFQPETVRAEWRARLEPTVAPSVWAKFEAGADQARVDRYVQAPSGVTRLVVDLSAPIFGPDGVAAALTSPYVETPTAIPVPDTIAALRAAADEISAELGGQFQ
ncbi:IclR family transcriptional regulator [Caulobacter sp. UNC279MFTsu5.1]|uniref:IclR family transcriptional regulator n=1 Tax=Caulobacter sp. UNC279MFTsu5.1 TaxID=1502775 RepID=UPI0008EB749C|nr:helix-turn-helix domain-containing protein [Caulobacter sp. UNC279MFTsu5.1]SFJ35969.1 DNA-binding transcriptional regulator, IclR family [Caulobacter sp. UNC279MFTsu5.1]